MKINYEKYLKTLNSYELFKLGKKHKFWLGKNPFKDEKQNIESKLKETA